MWLKNSLRKPFPFAFYNIVLILIGVNLLVHLFLQINPNFARYIALNPVLVIHHGMIWQIFTYQFVHNDFTHLVSNMIGLFFFGSTLERDRNFGSLEFALFYLVCGTLSGFLSLVIYAATGAWYVFLMGASGSIFAVLLLYAVKYPHSVIYLWAILPVPAPLLVIGYAVIEFFSIITGRNSGVAHATHLLGFAVAWLYCLIRYNVNPYHQWFKK